MDKVTLLEGIFKTSQEKGKEYLLDLDEDRLLAPCYEAIGQKPKKERYGGWEAKEISGHSLGHFLSALATMYTEDNDYRLKKKIDYIVSELAYLQKLDGTGYVSGFKRKCFDNVFSGEFAVSRFELGGSWVPWYSIHKIFAGLIDVYKLTNNTQALEVLTNLADWAVKGTNKLNDELFEKMMYCEHGGMCDAMADLYNLTNNKEYLKLSTRFIDKEVMNPLFNSIDDLEGKHANTQIPKLIGAAKLYKILKEEKYKTASEFFWNEVTYNRSYVIGGNSIDEHFEKVNAENLGVTTAETCNTYNMLKLTEELYSWNHSSYYMDYYERALYNHILASQDPETGMKTYFVSTKPGHFKVYSSPYNSFWCCTGTGMENPGRYTRGIYFRDNEELYVNLFIASKIEIEDKDIEILQETKFPSEDKSILKFKKCENKYLDIKIRVPKWLAQDMSVLVNNNEKYDCVENGYISIKRNWNKGDIISIKLPMKLNVYSSRDDKNKIAFMYGPIVLGGALGRDNFPETDILEDHLKLNKYPDIKVPTLVTNDNDISKFIELVDREKLEFKINGICEPNHKECKLIPFYNIHHERYTIYWTKLTRTEYENNNSNFKDYEEKLNEISVDLVKLNNQQSEIEHNVQVYNTKSDYLSECEKGYRECIGNGYFSYEMQVNYDEPRYLCLRFWGNEKKDNMRFKIFIDDNLLVYEKFEGNIENGICNKFYLIPSEIFKNKSKARVKICSEDKEVTGKVFELRITREKI